jgi:hypothetical protein
MSIQLNTSTAGLLRGTIEEILETGEIIVTTSEPASRILCDFLRSAHGQQVALARGDAVLIFPPGGPNEKGVVMGRIGPYQPPDLEHVTLEAGATLTLRCGESSVLLRQDGKVLTRAVDIAAIANRTHRLKGGSVEIN